MLMRTAAGALASSVMLPVVGLTVTYGDDELNVTRLVYATAVEGNNKPDVNEKPSLNVNPNKSWNVAPVCPVNVFDATTLAPLLVATTTTGPHTDETATGDAPMVIAILPETPENEPVIV